MRLFEPPAATASLAPEPAFHIKRVEFPVEPVDKGAPDLHRFCETLFGLLDRDDDGIVLASDLEYAAETCVNLEALLPQRPLPHPVKRTGTPPCAMLCVCLTRLLAYSPRCLV
jgi:hypothetical protein